MRKNWELVSYISYRGRIVIRENMQNDLLHLKPQGLRLKPFPKRIPSQSRISPILPCFWRRFFPLNFCGAHLQFGRL